MTDYQILFHKQYKISILCLQTDRFPHHMSICHGPIKAKKKRARSMGIQDNKLEEAIRNRKECHLCMNEIEDLEANRVLCISPHCKLVAHLKCLAKLCLEPGHYVPIKGECPICETKFLWGDIIRKKKGCSILIDVVNNDNADDFDI